MENFAQTKTDIMNGESSMCNCVFIDLDYKILLTLFSNVTQHATYFDVCDIVYIHVALIFTKAIYIFI